MAEFLKGGKGMQRVSLMVTLVTLVLMVAVVSCGVRKSSYVGTWRGTATGSWGNQAETTMVLNSDGSCNVDNARSEWQIEDGKLKISNKEVPEFVMEGKLSEDGKSLVLTIPVPDEWRSMREDRLVLTDRTMDIILIRQ